MKVYVTVKIEAGGGGSVVSASSSGEVEAGSEIDIFNQAAQHFLAVMAEHKELHPENHRDIEANAPLPSWLVTEVKETPVQ